MRGAVIKWTRRCRVPTAPSFGEKDADFIVGTRHCRARGVDCNPRRGPFRPPSTAVPKFERQNRDFRAIEASIPPTYSRLRECKWHELGGTHFDSRRATRDTTVSDSATHGRSLDQRFGDRRGFDGIPGCEFARGVFLLAEGGLQRLSCGD